MTRKMLTFGECEHNGDLEMYKRDIVKAGAKVINAQGNFHNEYADILVEFEDEEKFKKKFSETDSYQFCWEYELY